MKPNSWVNSQCGTRFSIWSTSEARHFDYLIPGIKVDLPFPSFLSPFIIHIYSP